MYICKEYVDTCCHIEGMFLTVETPVGRDALARIRCMNRQEDVKRVGELDRLANWTRL